ncbi:MAG: penicillin-binding protein activator [Myxococcales bacterium]|nr:penicillin-binding protein activator [Myxococcales bacterium]
MNGRRGVQIDVTDAFRKELDRANSSGDRLQIAEDAVETALEANQPLQAVYWLLDARSKEKDSDNLEAYDVQILDLIDGGGIQIDRLEALLEQTQPSRFPHEHLLFKLALLQLHARALASAESTLNTYRQTYPNGLYVSRVTHQIRRLRSMERVKPKTIGVLLPLTGPRSAFGRFARQALELAFRGANVRVVIKDTRGEEGVAADVVESLVVEDNAIVLLGPIFRSESRAAAAAAQRLETPLLTISAVEDISRVGSWIFRNGVTNQAQAKALVKHVMEVMNFERFAILHPRHPYGEELRDFFWDEVLARGGTIQGIESYDHTATTFSTEVKRLVGRFKLNRRDDYLEAIKECEAQPDPYRQSRCEGNVRKSLKPLIDFDALFIPDYARNVRMIAAALAAEDIIVEKDPQRLKIIERTLGRLPKVVTLLGASGWNSARITESTGRTVENAVFTDGFFAKSTDERTAQFVEAYRARFGRSPNLYPEALIYDSARLIRQILERDQPTTREALRQALLAVDAYPGVTGQTSFAGASDASKSLKILTIVDGTIVEFGDSSAAERRESAAR